MTRRRPARPERAPSLDDGEREALAGLHHRIGEAVEAQRDGLSVKVRSLAKPMPARFEDGTVHFERPEYGVAPGQAAVLYDGDRVLGGGWIEETVAAELEPA